MSSCAVCTSGGLRSVAKWVGDRQPGPKFGRVGALVEGRSHEIAICHKEAPPFGVCI